MITVVVAVPVMVIMMLLADRQDVKSAFRLSVPLRIVGWAATIFMAVAAAGMFATIGR